MYSAIDKAFTECGAYYRDTLLSTEILSLYKVGVIFREPTFCDATNKFGGFADNHRYLIISANARGFGDLDQRPEWGMCIWKLGSIFKVIDINEKLGKTQITLLEVPEAFRSELTTKHLSEMEKFYSHQAEQKFHYALLLDALPVHQSKDWLSRLKFPIGIDDNGLFFESWHYKN